MATKTWQGNGDNWTTAADWDPSGVPDSGDDVVVASGDPQVTTDVGTIDSLADSATVDLTEGTTPGGVTTFATLAVSGATTIANNSSLNLNDHSTFTTGSLTNDDVLSISGGVGNGTGGDRLTVNGLLTNAGGLNMGGATFDQRTAGDLLTTQGLSNTGSISLSGPGAANVLTEIDVTQQAAGFGTAGVLTGSVSLANNSEIVFDQGGGITQIGNGGLGGLTLDGTQASIQDAGGDQNSALTGVSEIESGSGLSLGDGAVLNLSGNLQNDGGIGLDTFSTSVGGTQLNVAGTLTNTSSGGVTIDAKNGNDTITVGGLSQPGPGANGGNITLYGSAPGAATSHLAMLDVTSQAAGFGTAGELTGRLYLSGDALVQFDGGEITTIGGGTYQTAGSLTLDGSLASVSNGSGQNSALAISSVASSSNLDLADGASLTTGDLDNAGGIGLDSYSTDYGTSGSTLTVNGTLTNTGNVTVDTSKAPDTLTTQGLSSTGSIDLTGASSALAELNVTNQAAGFGTAGVLTGSVSLYGDSLLEFAGGQLTTIATQSTLTLDGAQASLSNGGAQDSAITSLTENDGSFNLQDGASLALTGGFTNAGSLSLNNFHESTADTLTVAGTLNNSGTIGLSPDQAATTIDTQGLTNTGTINISGSGDTGTPEAMIDVTDQAAGFGTAGVLTGHVNLYGFESPAVIQFASGEITTIAKSGELTLDGGMASIQDGDDGINSALTGLAENDGTVELEDGASLTTTGDLTNTGSITLGYDNHTQPTTTTLDVGGTLTNSGTLNVGNGFEGASTTVEVQGLTNVAGTTDGTINVFGKIGSNNTTDPGLLEVAGPAGFGTAGMLTGNVNVDGSVGPATIRFASGGITTIASNSELTLEGAMASIQDAGGTQNDALTGLAENDGGLYLEYGASLTTSGNLDNTGQIQLYNGSTNNVLDIGGTLTNSGSVNIDADANNPTIEAQGIDNVVGSSTTGSIDLEGAYNNSTMQSYEAELNVSGPAGFGTQGVLTGNVTLGEYGVVQFASGGIGTIAAGSALSLNSTTASMQDAGGAQNSALAGLSNIAGTLTVQYSAALATGGAATGAAGTLTVGNTMAVSGRVNATTVDVATGGDLTLSNGAIAAAVTVESGGTFAGTGTTYGNSVTVASGGTFNPGGDPGAISTGSLSLASGSTFAIDLGGTPQSGNFDQDDVSGTVSLGGATFSGALVDGYTPTVGDSFEIISNNGNAPVSGTFAGLAQGAVTDIGGNDFRISYTGGDGNDVTLTDVGPVCYAAGTRIRTTRGEVPVEALVVGDLVVTSSGARRPVRWLGHRRLDCRRHPRPWEVMPVRIGAHALGEARPARDLRVSPGHAICLDLLGEVLVPAVALVNGATITQDDVDTIAYWHVELDSHDIILAENLPAESYIDCGNRAFFAEAGVVALDVVADARHATTADYCRPFHPADSRLVAFVRDQLRARAEALGWRLAAAAAPDDVWLEVDGQRIEPARSGLVARALLPASAREVFLCSTVAVPSQTTGRADGRRLGVNLAGLVVDDGLDCRREIACGDPRLAEGFHGDEGAHRWSDGRARLPAALWDGVAGDFFLRIALAGPVLARWVAPTADLTATTDVESAEAA